MLYWSIKRAIGGIADGSRRGYPDSYRYGEFVDYRSDPDAIGVLPSAEIDIQEGVLVDLPLWIVTDGTNTFAYGNTGHIYERNGDGDWTDIHTVPTSHGNGMAIFNDYLYYTGDSALGRYGPLSGAPTFTDAFQVLDTDEEYHPIEVFQQFIVIGNGQKVAKWDGAIYTAAILLLAAGFRVKCLELWGQYMMIGMQKGDTPTSFPEGRAYLWDGISTNYNDIVPFSGAVNSMINDNGDLMCFIGGQSDLYQYNGGRALRFKHLPEINLGHVEVLPGASGMWNNDVIFGTAAGDSTTVPKGVFTWGEITKDYPKSLSFDYNPSTGSKTGTTVSVGAVCQLTPSKMLFGWQDGSTFGIDRVDGSQYAATSTLHSLIFDNNRPFLLRRPVRMRITLRENFRAAEFVNAYIRKGGETDWTLIGRTNELDDIGNAAFTFQTNVDLNGNEEYDATGFQHQIRIDYGGTGSTRPTLTSVTVEMEEWDDIER